MTNDKGAGHKKREQFIAGQRAAFKNNPLLALRETLTDANNKSSDRLAARIALIGVIEFMNSCPEMLEPGLLAPLIKLSAALGELGEGKVEPMLTPGNHLPHRPTESSFRSSTKALTVRAIETLMDHCSLKRGEAARRVVAILQKHGIPMGRGNSNDADVKAVLRWRAEIKNASHNSDIGGTYLALSNLQISSVTQSQVVKNLDESLREVRLSVLPE